MQPAMLTRVAALFLALALANCAQNPVTGNPNLVLLSESQEIAVGRSEDSKVRQEFGVYDYAPLRMRVITAQAGQTFAELAKRSPVGRFAEGHLRVINGLYPAGEPVAGQPLKIVEQRRES